MSADKVGATIPRMIQANAAKFGDAAAIVDGECRMSYAEVAHEMLTRGQAYYCYCTAEELRQMREQAVAEGRSPRYDGRWRDRDPKDAPAGVKPAIRLKAWPP